MPLIDFVEKNTVKSLKECLGIPGRVVLNIVSLLSVTKSPECTRVRRVFYTLTGLISKIEIVRNEKSNLTYIIKLYEIDFTWSDSATTAQSYTN